MAKMFTRWMAVALVTFMSLLLPANVAHASVVGTLQVNPSSLKIDVGQSTVIDVSSNDSTIATTITASSTVAKYATVSPVASLVPGHYLFAVSGLAAGTAAIKVHAAKGYADLLIPVSVATPTLRTTAALNMVSTLSQTFTVSASSGNFPSNKNLVVTSNKSSVLSVVTVGSVVNNAIQVTVEAHNAGSAKLTISMTGYVTTTLNFSVTSPKLKSDKTRLAILPDEVQYVQISSDQAPLTDLASLQVHGRSASQYVTIDSVGSTDSSVATFAISVTRAVDSSVTFSLAEYTSITVDIAQPTLKVTSPNVVLWQTQTIRLDVTSDDPDFLAGVVKASEVEGKDASLLNFTSRRVDVVDGTASFQIQALPSDTAAGTLSTQLEFVADGVSLKSVVVTFTIKRPALVVDTPSVVMAIGESKFVNVSSKDLPLNGATVPITSSSNAAVDMGLPRNGAIEIRGIDSTTKPTIVTIEVAGYSPVTVSVQVNKTPEIPKVPAVKVAPSITGTIKVGATLTAVKGTWTGSANFTYTYKWYRCTSTAAAPSASVPSGCASINGATAATYKITKTDIGAFIRVAVSAVNSAGTTISVTKSTAKVLK